MNLTDNTEIQFSSENTMARFAYDDGSFSEYFPTKADLIEQYKKDLVNEKIKACGYVADKLSKQLANAPKSFPDGKKAKTVRINPSREILFK